MRGKMKLSKKVTFNHCCLLRTLDLHKILNEMLLLLISTLKNTIIVQWLTYM
jgi:hypothetical protein